VRDVLILTDPGSSNALSASEIAAVAGFVEDGGTLIITSAADYTSAAEETRTRRKATACSRLSARTCASTTTCL
jgi:hypothetical protein